MQLQSEVFQRRADAFLFQRVVGEPVTITLGERRIDAGQSDRVGHFQQSIDLAADDIEALAEGTGGACRWLTYGAALTGPADQVDTDARPCSRQRGGFNWSMTKACR